MPDRVPPDNEQGRGVSRRQLLQRAAAAGGALSAASVLPSWTTPSMRSLHGPVFAQASPAATGCIILSPSSSDKDLLEGPSYCPIVTKPCCGAHFGNAGAIDRFFFTNPTENCSQIVVRTIALDCNTAGTSPERNPDIGQFAVVIESTTGAGCGTCRILDAVLIDTSERDTRRSMNNGPVSCLGGGVDASLSDCPNVSGLRLAVRLICEGCDPA